MLRNYKKQYPLITRIVLYTFFFAIVVSVLVSAVWLYLSYTLEKKKLSGYLDKIKETQLETLVNNVWRIDMGAIDIQMTSILDDPDIVYIWLKIEPESNSLIEYGENPGEGAGVISREFGLVRKSANGEKAEIGSVGFVATTENISNQLLVKSSGSLLVNVITIIAACMFVLFLFITLYSRHINRIVNYARELDIGGLDRKLILQRRETPGPDVDEIGQIVDALDSMRIRLDNEMQSQYRTEKELIREKAFSDALINSLPGILFVLDEDLRLVRMNNAFVDVLGVSAREQEDYDVMQSLPDDYKEELEELLRELLDGGGPVAREINLRGAAGGRPVPFLLTAQSLEMDNNKYVIGIGTDLTDRKRMESQLRQAQKMEALGTLAGGISHDFNNILSAIVGYTNLAKLEFKGEGKLGKYLDTIEEASERAKTLVQQILAFSRKTEGVKEPVKVADIVKEALMLLRSSLPSTIQIKQSIESDLFAVVDPTEIHQVMMNLCTNAYHAMQDFGGILSISLTERVVKGEDCFPDSGVADGTYLVLEVSDTGCGMDEETRSKIFEPYFTTKDTGVGTGLGLSVVHGVVTSYRGYIHVYSLPGKGTAFSVFLPAFGDSSAAAGTLPEDSAKEIAKGRGERILVVDDEQFILDFYIDLLSRYRYEVDGFLSSVEAITHFHQSPNRYDLAIVDQIMPKIQGDRLAEGLWKVEPDLPVILCSGFSGSLGKKEFLEKGFAAYIQKPVNGELLLQTIRKVLDGSDAG